MGDISDYTDYNEAVSKLSPPKYKLLPIHYFGRDSYLCDKYNLSMKVELKNINKIRNASIELNSLTVIAGANDSGKSTVGKVLFSTIKALISGLNDSEEQKLSLIKDKGYLFRQRMESFQFDEEQKRQNDELFPLGFELDARQIKDIQSYFDPKEKWINSLDIVPRQKMLLLKDLTIIKNLLIENADNSTRVKGELQSYIESEFLNNICSCNTDKSSIKFTSDASYVDIQLQENDVMNVVCKMDSKDVLEDITYVESPLYIHILDALLNTITYREFEKNQKQTFRFYAPMVAIHIKDIAQKLINSSKLIHVKRSKSNLLDIKSITGGSFEYDKDMQSLVWKNDSLTLSPINVASGVKSFGVIQLLLAADTINENKMLIWDEPENHLHPKWQIEFAHLLVNLAKAGIPVVVSSHSPYFIQGIRYFSRKEQIDKYVNYYLAEETEDGLADINEVTNDLNRIFTKLAEPLNEIMNLD